MTATLEAPKALKDLTPAGAVARGRKGHKRHGRKGR